jgi:hypothetical protein
MNAKELLTHCCQLTDVILHRDYKTSINFKNQKNETYTPLYI